MHCTRAYASRNPYSHCVPQFHTRSAPLDTMSTQLGITSPLTTRSEDSLMARPSRTTTPTDKDKGIVGMIDKDTHGKRQVCSPTQRVGNGHGISCEGNLPVRRVYKQPRQRVRWACEYCQTTFTTSVTCRTCEHQKCGSCTRDP